MKRLDYLDILRGIAILLMVVDHAFDWWLNAAGQASPWGRWTEFLGTLAAPLFLFLVGVGLVLSYGRAVRKGKTSWEISLRFLRRGVVIFLSGYLFNLLIFFTGANPQDIWGLDVLHTIGLSVIFSIPLLWLPTPAAAAVVFGLFVLGQTLREPVLPGWLGQLLTGGYFPLSLWLPYAALGLTFGKVFHEGRLEKRDILLLFGLGVLSFWLIPFVSPAWGYRHPMPTFILFSVSVIVWLVAIAWIGSERLSGSSPVVRILQQMGQASLMLYGFHHLVGYRLFWLLGWVSGRSWRGEYGVFTPPQAAGFVSLTADRDDGCYPVVAEAQRECSTWSWSPSNARCRSCAVSRRIRGQQVHDTGALRERGRCLLP